MRGVKGAIARDFNRFATNRLAWIAHSPQYRMASSGQPFPGTGE